MRLEPANRLRRPHFRPVRIVDLVASILLCRLMLVEFDELGALLIDGILNLLRDRSTSCQISLEVVLSHELDSGPSNHFLIIQVQSVEVLRL